MDWKNKYTDEECRYFTDTIMEMGDEWFDYMHSERYEPDEPETLMKRHLELFDGDWMGLIDFDRAMGVWSTKYFYNKATGSTSETLIEEAESVEQAANWMAAIRQNAPIIIEDVESIKDSSPEEYAMYKRLHVQSVLAVPYSNNGEGLLVVRNPKKFKTNYVALNIMSYIITNELIAMRRRKNICRKTVECEPQSYKQVQIRLFGEMQIVGKDLLLTQKDIPEPIRFLIAYLAMHDKKTVSAEKLTELYGEKVGAWKNLVYRFRTKWKNARMLDMDEYQLIVTNEKGYTLNPNLEIFVDANHVSEMMKTIEDAGDKQAKLEMLRRFMAMYRGEFLQEETYDNLFIQEYQSLFNVTFVSKMDMLLEILYSRGQLDALIGYSHDILTIYPGSVNVYAWRISAFRARGQMDLAKETFKKAKLIFDEEELKMLTEKVNRIANEDKKSKKLLKRDKKH